VRLPAHYPLPRLLYAALGYTPIGALCISLFGILPLHLGTRFIVLPAALACIVLAFISPPWGRRALAGFLAGGLVGATVFNWAGFVTVLPFAFLLAVIAAGPVWDDVSQRFRGKSS